MPMSVNTLDLPFALDVKDGESVHVEMDCVGQEGRIVVKRMTVAPESKRDKKTAVLRFLRNWSGVLAHRSVKELEELREAHLREKHLK
jgi:hypothetical protein